MPRLEAPTPPPIDATPHIEASPAEGNGNGSANLHETTAFDPVQHAKNVRGDIMRPMIRATREAVRTQTNTGARAWGAVFGYWEGVHRSMGNHLGAEMLAIGRRAARYSQADTDMPDPAPLTTEVRWKSREYPVQLERVEGSPDTNRILLIDPPPMASDTFIYLGEGANFIKSAQRNGYAPWIMRRGNPDSRHAGVGFNDFALQLDEGADVIRREVGEDAELTAMGICQSGLTVLGNELINPGKVDMIVLVVPNIAGGGDNRFAQMVREQLDSGATEHAIREWGGVLPGWATADFMEGRDLTRLVDGPRDRRIHDAFTDNEASLQRSAKVLGWLLRNDDQDQPGQAALDASRIIGKDALLRGEMRWKKNKSDREEDKTTLNVKNLRTPVAVVAFGEDDIVIEPDTYRAFLELGANGEIIKKYVKKKGGHLRLFITEGEKGEQVRDEIFDAIDDLRNEISAAAPKPEAA